MSKILTLQQLESLHHLMDFGLIGHCGKHQESGECKCCLFDTGLGNWIGLLPGEDDYLKKGDQATWEIKDFSGQKGLVCGRAGLNCTNKPLDCKLYPFFPCKAEIEGVDEDGEWTYLIARNVPLICGAPKCPLFISNSRAARRWAQPKIESNIRLRSFAAMVRMVGTVLTYWGFGDWLDTTAKGYKGYEPWSDHEPTYVRLKKADMPLIRIQ